MRYCHSWATIRSWMAWSESKWVIKASLKIKIKCTWRSIRRVRRRIIMYWIRETEWSHRYFDWISRFHIWWKNERRTVKSQSGRKAQGKIGTFEKNLINWFNSWIQFIYWPNGQHMQVHQWEIEACNFGRET